MLRYTDRAHISRGSTSHSLEIYFTVETSSVFEKGFFDLTMTKKTVRTFAFHTLFCRNWRLGQSTNLDELQVYVGIRRKIQLKI